ncbi:MAG: DNA alkylation repair protein [Oscillospiraceae bacterium]|jgi:3-methyladenine DNA glycosylase AlkD
MTAVENIQARLFALQDTKYRDFQCRLTPTITPEQMIGVRTPALRALARELRGTDTAAEFLRVLPHEYYDEYNLHGYLISEFKDYEETLAAVNAFLPYVDNWATCDLLSPKVFKKHRQELWDQIPEWLASSETFTVRFGIEMLMNHFLDEDFSAEVLERVAVLRSEEYYINMMIAWFFATALAKQWDASLPYVTQRRLDRWCHNKTIQKAVESYRITDEQKAYLKTLKY